MMKLSVLLSVVGSLVWTAETLDLNPETFRSKVYFPGDDCIGSPGYIDLEVVKTGLMCETSSCIRDEVFEPYYHTDCPTVSLKEYITSVFDEREFLIVEYSTNKGCSGGFHGVKALVVDGECHNGFSASYDGTGVLNIQGYAFTNCTVLQGQVGFTEHDYQVRQCRESAGFSYTLAWSARFQSKTEPPTTNSTDINKPTPMNRAETPSPVPIDGGKGNTGMVVGIVAGALVLVAVIGAFIWRSRHNRQPPDQVSELDDPLNELVTTPKGDPASNYTRTLPTTRMDGMTISSSHSRLGATYWDDREFEHLRVNVGDLNEVEEIGTGGFAKVMLVRHSNGTYLAAKQLLRVREEQLRESFLREIRLNSRLSHPRIVKLIGVAWTSELDVRALFEYMEGGDLQRWLKATKHNAMERQWTRMKVQILLDIAEALYYAHSLERPIIHRDLKSSNVLLDERMRAKLADFGVSRPESVTGTVTAGVGTALWMAPEVVTGERSYTTSADIYSFGVVISEVDTHELPYHDAKNQHGQPLPSSAIPYQVKDGAIVPTLSATCPPSIANLARRCLSFEPNSRPTARTVVRELEDALREFV